MVAATLVACAPPPPASEPVTTALTARIASPPARPARDDAAAKRVAPSPVPPEQPPLSKLAPLGAEAPLLRLPVEGHHPAAVSLPLGAVSPRPVVVMAHGAGGRPDTHCELWRGVVGDRGFVLCIAGKRTLPHLPEPESGYYFAGHPALATEITAAMQALVRAYPEHVDPSGPVFAGFSQGASMGSKAIVDHPVGFSRAMLIEGGYGRWHEWNVAVSRRFVAGGASRVLLVCGQAICADTARKTAGWMRLGGLEARVEHVVGAGHTYRGRVLDAVRDGFAWLSADDARW